ncbi:MAG: hypothetical protein HUJ71_04125 [Pseudobutyrivibrio sp.]|nr:hypothetical protein [Pseudobutyrivibrio sp.]
MSNQFENSHFLNNFWSNGNAIPVDVIASFNVNGMVKPLYIRIANIQYKIETYVETRTARISKFDCTIINNDRLMPIICLYYRDSGKWMLERY